MKNFRDFSNLDEKVVNVVQRKKLARRMSKLAKSSAFQAKKKRTLMRIRSSAKLLSAAKKKTVMAFRLKLYPGYKDMAMPQKVKADQVVLQRFGAKIDKVAKKTAKKMKAKEVERIASLKAKEKDES
tara:strand:+ start:313 stop:693 length:381 start_codon:yes stop_codon:yes gene_type:complete